MDPILLIFFLPVNQKSLTVTTHEGLKTVNVMADPSELIHHPRKLNPQTADSDECCADVDQFVMMEKRQLPALAKMKLSLKKLRCAVEGTDQHPAPVRTAVTLFPKAKENAILVKVMKLLLSHALVKDLPLLL